MKKQIDVIFAAVSNFLNEREPGSFVSKETHAKSMLSKADTADIVWICIEATRNGEASVNGKKRTYDINSDKDMKEYWRGALSNHLRRDPRLNGGTERKDLGEVKQGPRDPQLKALRALLEQTVTDEDKADVQAAIDSRLAEVKPAKSTYEIDVDILPDHLKHLVS